MCSFILITRSSEKKWRVARKNSMSAEKTFTRIGVVIALLALGTARPASAQDWIKTGTGLGVTKARVAAPDLASRTAAAQPLEKTFHGVLWNDLEYSGILDMVSQSFYPLQVPSQPSELNAQQWAAAPASAYMVAYGGLTLDGTDLS